MATYLNFYETIAEATMRLKNTVVLYDGEPYMILHIGNHFTDGIFRVYMEPFGHPSYLSFHSAGAANEHNPFYAVAASASHFVHSLDNLIEKQKEDSPTRLIRKMMNSPLFGKFRPFPLGMVKLSPDKMVYTERSPTRRVEQGLVQRMVRATIFNVACLDGARGSSFGWQTPCFRDTIMGVYPTPQEALKFLSFDENYAAPYSRFDGFVKSIAEEIFVVHKNNRVGSLPSGDLSVLRLNREYRYLIEYYQESGIYSSVTVE
jgi:hypothetical protein